VAVLVPQACALHAGYVINSSISRETKTGKAGEGMVC
jgi:hypothetical protein